MSFLESAELQGNEALKGFGSADDLAKSYLDLHGKVSSGSIELLPEEIRNNETVKTYKNLPEAMKGLIETKKLVGTIKRAPTKPEDYKFTAPEGLHQSLKDVSGFQKVVAEGVHKLGLAEDQADGVQKIALGYFSQMLTQSEKAREELRQKNEAELRKDWGQDFDKNYNGIVRALTKAGGEEAIKDLAPALKNAPVALKALGRIVSMLSEDSIESLGTGPAGSDEGEDKEFNALSEAIRTNDQKHPLMNEKLAGHQEAKKKWAELSMKHFATATK